MKKLLLLLILTLVTITTQFSGARAQLNPRPRVFGAFGEEDSLDVWPPFVHWDLREFPDCQVPWALGSTPVPDLDGNGTPNTVVDRVQATNAFLGGFAAWSAVTPAIIGFKQSASAAGKAGLQLDGYNTLSFGDGAFDDVQLVPLGGAVPPGGVVVGPGPNGVLETTPYGDDAFNATHDAIVDGINGICETAANNVGAIGNDIQIFPVGSVPPPGAPIVVPGPGGFLETEPEGDDVVVGNAIYAGPDGIADTHANNEGTLGLTAIFFSNSTGIITEADIVFSSSAHWTILGNNNCVTQLFNLQGVATHEIGHFIGIAHPRYVDPAFPDGADGVSPTMHAFVCSAFHGNKFNTTLEDSDKDSCNFLYCPDLGDAPDPCVAFNVFPTLVHSPTPGRKLNNYQLFQRGLGAEHLFGIKDVQPGRNWTYEWLRRWYHLPFVGWFTGSGMVNAECEANVVDVDALDNGVTWTPNPPVWGKSITVKEWITYAADDEAHMHNYQAHKLYGNAWLDTNQDCQWLGYEHFIQEEISPAMGLLRNQKNFQTVEGSIALPLVVNPDVPVWLRCRVDWGEHSGSVANIDGTLVFPRGAAQFGEVEDYPFYCTHRYETVRLCNPYPFVLCGFALAYVGPSTPDDATYAAVVDANGCTQTIDPPAVTSYNPVPYETVVEYPVPGWVPPFFYHTFRACRNNPHTNPPQEFLRAFATVIAGNVTANTPAEAVPTDLRIPTSNCAYHVYEQGSPNYGKVRFTVGAVDFATGGWLNGPDALTGEWDDSLRVNVSYRVVPNVIPIENLSPCDPVYNQYPLHPVGNGRVTPEDAFEFELTSPGQIPVGQHVILEVQCRWSENPFVANQIVEFPDPIGTATGVEDNPVPARLALENHPNPFNPTTVIRYALPKAAEVTLKVFDVQGRLVRTLVASRHANAGVYDVEWNGIDDRGTPVASGVYFYRLTAGTENLTRKMVLLK